MLPPRPPPPPLPLNKGAPIKGKRKGKGKKRSLMSSEVGSDSGGKLKPKGRWAGVSNKAHT